MREPVATVVAKNPRLADVATVGASIPVRYPVRAALDSRYRQGMTVEEILQQYPMLTPADVYDALAFAYDHLDAIEAALADDDEAAVKAGLLRD